MLRKLLLALALMPALCGLALGAGSIVTTTSDLGQGVTKYSIAWTCDASGVLSVSTVDLKAGRLVQMKYIPGSGGTQPSDLYDLTLLDANGVDLLAGGGANLSNANSTIAVPTAPYLIEAGSVIPTIANAGNAKTGTIILYVRP